MHVEPNMHVPVDLVSREEEKIPAEGAFQIGRDLWMYLASAEMSMVHQDAMNMQVGFVCICVCLLVCVICVWCTKTRLICRLDLCVSACVCWCV